MHRLLDFLARLLTVTCHLDVTSLDRFDSCPYFKLWATAKIVLKLTSLYDKTNSGGMMVSHVTLSANQLSNSDSRREQLIEICETLPEITYEPTGDGHFVFRIRKKNFAYYLFDHHGDGVISFCCKSSLSEQRRLIRSDAETFFVPAYLGSKGWVGIRLDLDEVDWEIVTELARRAYQATAPRKLAALID